MSKHYQEWVVDAGVGVNLFVNGPFSSAAHRLFAQLTTDSSIRLHVPDLFYIEVANVLWKYVQWQNLPVGEAQANLHELGQLDLQVTSTATLMADALTQGALYGITAYDGCYVALAQRLSLPLLTTDAKLIKRIQDLSLVQLLTA